MKKTKIKLHTKIILGLFFGALFGGIFHVDKNSLEIIFIEKKEEKKELIKNFDLIEFLLDGNKEIFKEQTKIIQRFQKLNPEEKEKLILVTREKSFNNIISINKPSTVATKIRFIGDIFIRLLNMIAIPLVFSSLIVGVTSLGDIKKLARIGGKTISFYIITTAIAISIGLILANIIEPGKKLDKVTQNEMISEFQNQILQKGNIELKFSFDEQLTNIVPKNIFKSMVESEMLQIVFFALLVGIALTMINKNKSENVIAFFDGFSESMIKLVDIVMLIAPYGVFALISATVAEFGFEIVQTLLWYAVTVLLGLVLHLIFVYGAIVKIFGKIAIGKFFKGIRRAQIVAFSTSSSAATLPVTMECSEENLGISKSITSFTLPLGATINMDGTALYQGVAAVFIAQVFGIDLSLFDQIVIVFTAVLASIGTAPVPGVGIIMLLIILKSVHVPEIGVALILGIDRILDMCRTVVNVTGDAAVTLAIARSEGQITQINLSEA